MDMTRTNYSSGAPLEESAGYSRMVRVGPFVKIGGTTSVQSDGTVASENDAYGQTKYILEKFAKLLSQAGAEIKDVVSVKAYAVDMKLGGEIARAYTEMFKEIRPLFTMVGTTALNRPTQLVEIELEAVITAS